MGNPKPYGKVTPLPSKLPLSIAVIRLGSSLAHWLAAGARGAWRSQSWVFEILGRKLGPFHGGMHDSLYGPLRWIAYEAAFLFDNVDDMDSISKSIHNGEKTALRI